MHISGSLIHAEATTSIRLLLSHILSNFIRFGTQLILAYVNAAGPCIKVKFFNGGIIFPKLGCVFRVKQILNPTSIFNPGTALLPPQAFQFILNLAEQLWVKIVPDISEEVNRPGLSLLRPLKLVSWCPRRRFFLNSRGHQRKI